MLRLVMMTFMDTNPQLIYKFTHAKEKHKMYGGMGNYGGGKPKPKKKKTKPRPKKVQGRISGSPTTARYSKRKPKPTRRTPK